MLTTKILSDIYTILIADKISVKGALMKNAKLTVWGFSEDEIDKLEEDLSDGFRCKSFSSEVIGELDAADRSIFDVEFLFDGESGGLDGSFRDIMDEVSSVVYNSVKRSDAHFDFELGYEEQDSSPALFDRLDWDGFINFYDGGYDE